MKLTAYLSVICCATCILACQKAPNTADTSWPTYKGSNKLNQYSSLAQIDTNNVKELQVAWTYHTGDADTVNGSQIQCNPIMVDGVLYGTTPQMKLFAVDAASGRELWKFNPLDSLPGQKHIFFIMNNSRGVAYWSNEDKTDCRIFYTAGSNLYCINAKTGKPVEDFALNGALDLHEGLDRPNIQDLFVTATTPGTIYKDLIIMGSRVDEGPAAAPGHIRAFEVRTGKRAWIFHTVPHPGEPGFDTWEDTTAYRFIGGANAWSGFSLDEKRGIVFAVTGSASYDFYGGKRLGDNLYANSLLALEAATGKLLWNFQSIHHDVWDRDFSSPPALVTIKKDGKNIDACALTTKTGFVFLFERETGKSIYPIEERPVPQVSGLSGEKLAPTQPFPTKPKPFVRQLMTEADINPLLSPDAQSVVRKRWNGYLHDNMFNPPSLQGTVFLPGLDGGGEWGGPSFDPTSGILYVNANEMAWVIRSVELEKESNAPQTLAQAGEHFYKTNCMTCHGPDRKGSGNNPSLVAVGKKYSPDSFDTLIQSGRRMMPAFKQLSEPERKAIAAFVLDLPKEKNKTYNGPKPAPDPTAVPYSIAGYDKFLTEDKLPALSPPWGTLNALDLSTGEWIWKKTLGNDPAFPNATEPTGTENYGGSAVTAGGLLFIAATKDGMFRAFNKRTGDLLWETKLPNPGFAAPAVYEVKGKQYIVIACGGGKLGTKSGDEYVAFALP
ncbi:MAG: PQQ-binding-like beta-propeller repeat protein [Bacteroidetes bacterium]|nr:PQQ-binding-like beta-propeller repeat protein [Bacteroidota bacterium]